MNTLSDSPKDKLFVTNTLTLQSSVSSVFILLTTYIDIN